MPRVSAKRQITLPIEQCGEVHRATINVFHLDYRAIARLSRRSP